ncbi:MAG: hypothetical protein JWQ90_2167 [Hydrocarboniphaga sp.]|uniref:hypothetical protein n=1 Tax=Hydrocarboniphaga sp. TaxID=2033016 RepID=UPI002624232E|nr:hypothetical protein [Hydrocarboniphaga sp.]MDB5969717.1 hypothetical protein [Hydrocarboniphaga sp.]
MPRTAGNNSTAARTTHRSGSQSEEPRRDLDFSADATPTRAGEHGHNAELREKPPQRRIRRAGAAAIGAGRGLDEAELADTDPVGESEARKLKRKADQHAHDPNAFEPHEAAEVAAREREKPR